MGSETLVFSWSQPRPEVSTENAAAGKGARPRRSLAADPSDRALFPKA